MVNTVGSYENINWHKKWIPIKRSLVLTEEQKSLINGSLLGDGTMRIGEGSINAAFKVEHGLVQKAYVEWKYQILKPFVFTEPKLSSRYRTNGEKYAKSWWFRTIRHPLLTGIHRRFYEGNGYRNGRKIVPPDIGENLTPLALAVWIMDDGSYSRGNIDISTYSFRLSEIEILRGCLRQIYGVDINYHLDRDKGYRMYCNQQETKKLVEVIRPYMLPSMTYKIGIRNPVTTELERARL